MQASLWHTSWWIPSANNTLGCCCSHCTTVALMSLSCFYSSLVLFWRAKDMEMKCLGCMEGGLTPSTTTCTECSGGAGQMQSVLDGFCTCKTGIEPCHTVPVYCNSPCTGHYYWWCVMHTATWSNATFCICQLSHRWDTFEQHILKTPVSWDFKLCTLVSVYQHMSYLTWLGSSSALL